MFLQFLNGSRDQQVEELNPAASLVIGSGDDAHIRVVEPGVEGRHCQVYPAQGAFWLQDLGAGNTILHMKRLKGTTEGLKAGDIFILGQTFVKFWTERPAVGAAAPASTAPADGGGAALEAAKKELQAAKAQAGELEDQLAAAKQEAQAAADEASRAQADAERERAGREEAERARDALAGEKQALEQKVAELEGDVERARADAEAQASKAREEAEAQVAAARADAEAELARGREALEREQAEGKAALEATRAELAALRAEQEARGRDRLTSLVDGAGDLRAWVEALGLDHTARVRLEAALEDTVTREALRRAAGPVVPLRGLRVPGCDRDLEAELGAARRAGERAAAARSLGLHDLDASELERLLEAARA